MTRIANVSWQDPNDVPGEMLDWPDVFEQRAEISVLLGVPDRWLRCGYLSGFMSKLGILASVGVGVTGWIQH